MLDVYTILPADLDEAEAKVRRCEEEWRQAGAVQATELQVDQAFHGASECQRVFNQAKAQIRPSLTWMYLSLVRLFVLTGMPRQGKATVIGTCAALIPPLSLLLCLFLFSPVANAFKSAVLLALCGFCLAMLAVFVLWPTEQKRETFQRLQKERKDNKERLEALRPSVDQAWVHYNVLHRGCRLFHRLEKARKRRDQLVTLLASVKYQLIHTDWRVLRGTDFEQFLSHVFETLGYQVQLTKKSGD